MNEADEKIIPTPDGLFPDGVFEKDCMWSQWIIAAAYEETQKSYINLICSIQYYPTLIARLEQDYEETKELCEKNKQAPERKSKMMNLATTLWEHRRDLKRYKLEHSYYKQKMLALLALMTTETKEILNGERRY